jgi:hypothetical protein
VTEAFRPGGPSLTQNTGYNIKRWYEAGLWQYQNCLRAHIDHGWPCQAGNSGDRCREVAM